MKRLILTITIVLVLIGIGTDVANAQINWQYIAQSEMIRHTSGGGRFPRIGGCIGGSIGGSRINWQYIAQSEVIRHTGGLGSIFGNYGGYGYYGGDSTLGKVLGYSSLGMGVFQMLDQSSIANRVVNNEISATNRMLSMDEREQEFRHQQIRAQTRARGKMVLIREPEQGRQSGSRVALENQRLANELRQTRLEIQEHERKKELEKTLAKAKEELEQAKKQ